MSFIAVPAPSDFRITPSGAMEVLQDGVWQHVPSKAREKIESLEEKVAILEAELRVVYKLPGEIDRLMREQ